MPVRRYFSMLNLMFLKSLYFWTMKVLLKKPLSKNSIVEGSKNNELSRISLMLVSRYFSMLNLDVSQISLFFDNESIFKKTVKKFHW
jgi:hypothetical protein